MKKTLKYLWAWLWFHSRLMDAYIQIRDRISGSKAVILMYHRVVPECQRDKICSVPEIVVTERCFESQLEFLAGKCRVMSLEDLTLAFRERRAIPARTVVITFDDGWEDNYRYAWPVLKKYNLPATIFLTAGLIGTREIFWQEITLYLVGRLSSEPAALKKCFEGDGLEALHPVLDAMISGKRSGTARLSLLQGLMDRGEKVIDEVIRRMLAALDNPALPVEDNSFLSWEQVSEMNGLIAFGSHGISHKLLDKLEDELIIKELCKSRELIEGRLRGPVLHFAYPNGNYNNSVVERLREAGYETAVTTKKGLNTCADDLCLLKRINICDCMFEDPKGRFSIELFAARLAGLL